MPEQKNPKQKNLKINAVLNSTRSVLGLVFPLITFPYSSRVLGPEGLGKVNFAQSIISYFAMIAAIGISSYSVREAAKLRNNKCELSKFVKEIITINLCSTIFAYILLIIALCIIPKFSDYRNLLIICSCSILFTTFGMEWLYVALEDFTYITIRSLVFQIISLVLLFLFVKTEDDILKYAGIGIVSSVGSNVCNFLHVRHFLDLRTKEILELKKHLKPIFLLFSMSIAVSIYTSLDTTMLGFLAGDEQVGYYSAATKINRMVLSVITSAIAVLMPRLSYYVSQGDKEQFSNLAVKAFNVTTIISFPCAAGLSLVAYPIIHVFSGTGYEPAVIVMKIMNPVIIAISFSNLIGIQFFMPLGKEKLTIFSVIFGAMINFTLNLFLIPRHGAKGAAIATVVAETVVTIVQLIFVRKFFNCKYVIPNLTQCIISTLVMVCVVLSVNKLKFNEFSKLGFSILSGVIIYSVSLLIFRNKVLLQLLYRNCKNEV